MHLGLALLGVFACFVLLGLIGGFWPILHSTDPDVVRLLKDGMIPYLQALAGTSATIFGPLLGFLFGYYFKSRDDA